MSDFNKYLERVYNESLYGKEANDKEWEKRVRKEIGGAINNYVKFIEKHIDSLIDTMEENIIDFPENMHDKMVNNKGYKIIKRSNDLPTKVIERCIIKDLEKIYESKGWSQFKLKHHVFDLNYVFLKK